MFGNRGKESFLAVFLLAFFLIFASLGAFIAYKINSCSRLGFQPVGCPIVIQVGR